MSIPRGLYNRNPGNIRKSKTGWLGKIRGRDRSFETFDSMAHGVRALALNLIAYQEKHGCHTVRQLITRWAPRNENNTGAYIHAVAEALGVSPDARIDVRNRFTMTGLVWAIAGHENGPAMAAKYMNRHEVDAGVAMAIGG